MERHSRCVILNRLKLLEQIRGEKIEKVHHKGEEIERENVVKGMTVVSVDATKVREKLGEEITSRGKKRYEIGFKDAKIALFRSCGGKQSGRNRDV